MRLNRGALALVLVACSSTPPVGAPKCTSPQVACSGVCTTTDSDGANCGACGKACSTGQACLKGACVASDCPNTDCAPWQVCPDGARCVDQACDGVTCPADQGCLGGQCLPTACASGACPPGHLCVNGACADTSCLGVLCLTGAVCTAGICVSSTCNDGVKSGDESDVDCGGSCTNKCDVGKTCIGGTDCASASCVAGQCAMPVSASCSDNVRDGDETDVDCGGACVKRCASGQTCGVAMDCQSGICNAHVCAEPATCFDNQKNNAETGTDCGGPDCALRCADGTGCALGGDCASRSCGDAGTCIGASCGDGAKNGTESDVDCGGTCPARCGPGQHCGGGTDCVGNVCLADAGICASPSCSDAVKDGTETDVDCGGLCPNKCHGGQHCSTSTDCVVGACTLGTCDADPSCTDMARNQDEVDVDCGGTHCAPCADGKACAAPKDCLHLFCTGQKCSSGYPMGTSYPVSHTGVSVTRVFVGKLNADSAPDVLALSSGNYYETYLGGASGTLGTATGSATCAWGGTALVDTNNDGALDRVTHCHTGAGGLLTTELGSGDGTFQSALNTTTNASNNTGGGLAFGDVNGDGKLDLVATNSYPTPPQLGVQLGTGLGNFGPFTTLNPGTTGSANNALLFDITGDGRLDILTAVSSGQVSIMVNNTPDGGATPVFALNSTSFSPLNDPLFIAKGDFNEDGKTDFAVATYNGQTLSLVLTNGSGFLPPLDYSLATYPTGMAVADLNADGHLDVVVTTVNGAARLFMGTGTGSFKPGAGVGTSFGAVAISDMDGDGRPDLVLGAQNAVWIYLNRQ